MKWRRGFNNRLLRNQSERLCGRTAMCLTHTHTHPHTRGESIGCRYDFVFEKVSARHRQHGTSRASTHTLSCRCWPLVGGVLALPNWKMDLCVRRTNATSKHWTATDAIDRPIRHTHTHTTANEQQRQQVRSLLHLEGGNCLCVLHENNKIHKSHKYRISNDLCSKNVNQNTEKPIVRERRAFQWQWRNATAAIHLIQKWAKKNARTKIFYH